FRLYLDHCEIGLTIHSYHFGIVLLPWRIIGQTHANAVRLFHHMVVGDNVALGIHDHARAQGPLPRAFGGSWTKRTALAAKEAIKKILHGIAIIRIWAALPAAANRFYRGFGVDVHYAGHHLLGDLRKC